MEFFLNTINSFNKNDTKRQKLEVFHNSTDLKIKIGSVEIILRHINGRLMLYIYTKGALDYAITLNDG